MVTSKPVLAPFAVWLSWAQLITWGSVFYTFSLLMGPIERELGLSRAEVSLGFSLALLADGLMAYPIGRWIDQGHERRVMAWGSVWVGACLLAHSFINSLGGLLWGLDWPWFGHVGHTLCAGVCRGDSPLSKRL
jgi:MFS family permease